MDDDRTQSDKFKEAARELECDEDEDEARLNEQPLKIAQQKPAPRPE
jgi:hypothetical protein